MIQVHVVGKGTFYQSESCVCKWDIKGKQVDFCFLHANQFGVSEKQLQSFGSVSRE